MVNVLLFRLREQRCVLPLSLVVEVAPMVAVLPIPGIAPPISGYIRFRGRAVAVVDLAQRLGLPTQAISKDEHLIIVALDHRLLALRVDRIVELSQCDDQLEPLEQSAAPLAGVVPREDGSLFLVDLTQVLSLEQRRGIDDALVALEGAPRVAP